MKKEDLEKLVATASPHDGFGIREVVHGTEHSLYIVFRVDGVMVNPPWRIDNDPTVGKLVWRCDQPQSKDFGEKARLRLLLEALCRFLNTCGTWEQLDEATRALWSMSQGTFTTDLCQLHLMDSCINSEGVAEHVFTDENSLHAIRWVEGQFFDVIALADLQKEVEAQEIEDGYDITFGGRPASPGDGEGRTHMDVQRTEDPAAAGPDATDPEPDLR